MNELLRLAVSKGIVNLLPEKGRTRIARFLYNYNSHNIKGIDIIQNYVPELGLKILINTREFAGWNIFFTGAYEKETNNLLQKFIKPDDIVIEAGAHYGTESVIIGKLLQKGKGQLNAFEPVEHVRKRLKLNVEINSLNDSVKIFPYALGNDNSTIDFFILSGNKPNQGLSSKYQFSESSGKIKVEQIKLDQWAGENNISRIDFLKMDVQGAEIDLLNGGKEIISRSRPIILTEASRSELKRSGNSIEGLYKKLLKLNCEVFLIKKNGMTKLSLDNLTNGNWIAFPS